jgi:hypothetical protein
LLANEIVSDKLKDGAMAGIAIAYEYFCDKTVDSRTQRKSNVAHLQEGHL